MILGSRLGRITPYRIWIVCDKHGVYVTKGSAEVIEIDWLLLDAKNCEEKDCRDETTDAHDQFLFVEPARA